MKAPSTITTIEMIPPRRRLLIDGFCCGLSGGIVAGGGAAGAGCGWYAGDGLAACGGACGGGGAWGGDGAAGCCADTRSYRIVSVTRPPSWPQLCQTGRYPLAD